MVEEHTDIVNASTVKGDKTVTPESEITSQITIVSLVSITVPFNKSEDESICTKVT